MRPHCILIFFVFSAISIVAKATVVEYTNKPTWQASAGAHSTITFTEWPVNTLVTTQYSHLGVTFTDGSDYIDGFSPNTYPNDGYGLNGAFDTIWLQFSQPIYSIASDFPGRITFKLYYQQQLIFTSTDFGGAGAGWFAGLISDEPFDSALLYDPTGGTFIDDLHFGPPIPAPGALALFALAACGPRLRRRVATAII